jgi:predicted transposase YdaD
MIEEPEEQGNLAACVAVLAGLRFDQSLIRQLFREEIMRESVIYREILQQGLQQGLQQEARSLIGRLLLRRFGAVDPQLQEQIQALSIAQLEELAEALLDFSAVTDLTLWLHEHQQ